MDYCFSKTRINQGMRLRRHIYVRQAKTTANALLDNARLFGYCQALSTLVGLPTSCTLLIATTVALVAEMTSRLCQLTNNRDWDWPNYYTAAIIRFEFSTYQKISLDYLYTLRIVYEYNHAGKRRGNFMYEVDRISKWNLVKQRPSFC